METLDALDLAQDFEKGQIQRSTNILQSVVVMHMQIARTFHDQGTTRMLGESMEHAIKEAGLGLNICNCRHQTMPLIDGLKWGFLRHQGAEDLYESKQSLQSRSGTGSAELNT